VKEFINTGSSELKAPFLFRNSIGAHIVSRIVDRAIGEDCTPEGRKLLRNLIVNMCQGKSVSISREASKVYEGARNSLEVMGSENIPNYGPTILVANHTRGGPLNSIGQFLEIAKYAYFARHGVDNEKIREPFFIMQRGLSKGKIVEFFSGKLYEIAGHSLRSEVVDIPRFNNSNEIINGQKIHSNAISRIVAGGCALWTPQGKHRSANDFYFPEQKGNGFLRRINNIDGNVALVPVKCVPETSDNLEIYFGKPVILGEVLENGGINYFAQKHLCLLGDS